MVKTEFISLSESTDFVEERNFREEWMSKKGLWNYVASKVLNGKGDPITPKSVRNTFKVNIYNELTPTQLAVWIESETIIRKVMLESKAYENTDEG